MRLLLVIAIMFTSFLLASESNLTLRLSWKHQFQFAGFYIAKEKGFYKEIGLDVKLEEYDNSRDTVESVISGESTFGIGKSSLLIDKSDDKPVAFLGTIYQNSPFVLITTDPNIKKLSDLKNKRIMITGDAIKSASIIGMLASRGITDDDIILQKHTFDLNDLIEGKTDAMAAYASNEPFALEKLGIKYKIFDPKEYGFDFYEDIIFTSKQELKEHPKIVKAFYEASIKGWLWAFNNIEAAAKIIYDKYNTQNKTLQALIYEGRALKKLALIDGIPFGSISESKLKSIAKVFQLKGMMNGSFRGNDLSVPFKKDVVIGVLAKRGEKLTHERWDVLAEHLNHKLDNYTFKIEPLDFTKLIEAVKNKKVDFVITNTMYYVLLEHQFGVSRVATLLNGQERLKEFGGVIFTKSSNKNINKIKDIKNRSFGAVSELSFGGWIMAYEEMLKQGVDIDDIDVTFYETHDKVVEAVVSGDVKVGTVRTDTLERMAHEGKIKLSQIKVIEPKHYDNFPFLVSTRLYPEWPIAKLSHTSDALANDLVGELLNFYRCEEHSNKAFMAWTVPLDYTHVHNVLKELRLPPYNDVDIQLKDIFQKYALEIYSIALLGLMLIFWLLYDRRLNYQLSKYNEELDLAVKDQTQKLLEANKKLKVLANTDYLTGISNRAHFMKFARKYFEIAKRNGEELQMLSLDLDHFKSINDEYGHGAGDEVLKQFTSTITELLRKSDLFGRTGGEEFCILLQNTSNEGAVVFAKRLCKAIESMHVNTDEGILQITVSIGIATLNGEKSVEELIKKSDVALYDAKEKGRNRVELYEDE